jgi:hypothetical protein
MANGAILPRPMMALAAIVLCFRSIAPAQEPVFSGPQPGEPLTHFEMRRLFGDAAGQMWDAVKEARGGPIVLIFVHEVTRPSAAVTRIVADYAHRLKEQGLHTAVVFLSDDPTTTQAWAARARHALPSEVPLGISLEGLEGPGAYGLNRHVMMTVVIGKQDRVTANFALIQPSVAQDAPVIGAAIQQVLGHDLQPTLAEMGGPAAERMENARRARDDDGRFRALLRPVIRKTATPDEVAAAAKKVEAEAEKDAAFRERLTKAARTIVESGKLNDYGTPAAQDYLKKWSEPTESSKPDTPEKKSVD